MSPPCQEKEEEKEEKEKEEGEEEDEEEGLSQIFSMYPLSPHRAECQQVHEQNMLSDSQGGQKYPSRYLLPALSSPSCANSDFLILSFIMLFFGPVQGCLYGCAHIYISACVSMCLYVWCVFVCAHE